MSGQYYEILKNRKNLDRERVMAIDLETLVASSRGFLTNERIIAASMSHFESSSGKIDTAVVVANSDSENDEKRLISEIDSRIREIDPEIIIGYNHTGYDIPLLQMKTRNFSYGERPRNLLYYLGTAWCLDMMYVIAEDLLKADGDYYIRKLDDVVLHERYSSLPLKRRKGLVRIDGMNKGEAVRKLWQEDRNSFIEYCEGDTHDILLIFKEIFG